MCYLLLQTLLNQKYITTTYILLDIKNDINYVLVFVYAFNMQNRNQPRFIMKGVYMKHMVLFTNMSRENPNEWPSGKSTNHANYVTSCIMGVCLILSFLINQAIKYFVICFIYFYFLVFFINPIFEWKQTWTIP